MPLLAGIRSLWRNLVRRKSVDADLDEELNSYLRELVEHHVENGMNRADAEKHARADIGGLIQVRDAVREERIGFGLENMVMDMSHAWRALRRSPGFTVTAVLTLALGIGATTAIFTVVRTMLLAPLPYRDSSRLVFVWSDMSAEGYPRAPLSAPELKDLRDRSTLFTGFGSIWATTAALTGDGEPEQLRVGLVSTNFFSAILGVDAGLGRTFAAEDETQAAPRTILLSWELFKRRFGGDTSIVGRAIRVNGQPATVIGVMPADFRLLMPPDAAVPDDLQAWVLLNPQALTRAPRGQQYLRVVGRMKPAVSLEQAKAEIDNIAAAISREFTDYGTSGRVFLTVGLQADGVRQLRPILLALFGAVGILLLIACVNVAALLVARAATRSRETAVRLALGAGRRRLAQQWLAEGIVLSTLGGVAGIAVGKFGLDALLALRPASLERLATAHIDVAVLAFTAGVSIVWGVLLSLAPLLETLKADVAGTLQQDGRRTTGALQYRTRAALVVMQIALSVVLLVGAALMVRTFFNIQQVDPGFQSEQELSFRISLPPARYGNPDAFNAFARQLEAELAAAKGVVSVGSISHVPFDNVPNWGGPYVSPPGSDKSASVFSDHRAVSPRFFETVGARLIEGRFFTEADDQHGEKVVIVDDQLARRTWPAESAIGKRIAADPGSTGSPVFAATVIGVIHHIRQRSLLEDLSDQVYFSERQILRNPMAYVVRTSGDPGEIAGTVRQVVTKLDPELAVSDLRPLSEYVTAARATQRFLTILTLAFAAVALALASIGVYGILAYTVTTRRYEFGVRLALGAQAIQVERLIVREGAALAMWGLVIGLIAAAATAQLLQSLLFGVTPWDAQSYLAAVLALAIAAVAASWLPAHRVSAIAPSTALRAG